MHVPNYRTAYSVYFGLFGHVFYNKSNLEGSTKIASIPIFYENSSDVKQPTKKNFHAKFNGSNLNMWSGVETLKMPI